jgi:hypothetical protein
MKVTHDGVQRGDIESYISSCNLGFPRCFITSIKYVPTEWVKKAVNFFTRIPVVMCSNLGRDIAYLISLISRIIIHFFSFSN